MSDSGPSSAKNVSSKMWRTKSVEGGGGAKDKSSSEWCETLFGFGII